MTTIACDGKTIACDTQISSGDGGGLKWPTRVCKIERIGDKYVGHSGDLLEGHLLLEYFRSGKKPEKRIKHSHALILYSDGKLYHTDGTLMEMEINPPFAIGSGGDFAYGAMLAGASPAEAIKLASKVDLFTNDDILVFHLKDLQKGKKKGKKSGE